MIIFDKQNKKSVWLYVLAGLILCYFIKNTDYIGFGSLLVVFIMYLLLYKGSDKVVLIKNRIKIGKMNYNINQFKSFYIFSNNKDHPEAIIKGKGLCISIPFPSNRDTEIKDFFGKSLNELQKPSLFDKICYLLKL